MSASKSMNAHDTLWAISNQLGFAQCHAETYLRMMMEVASSLSGNSSPEQILDAQEKLLTLAKGMQTEIHSLESIEDSLCALGREHKEAA